MPVRVNTYPAVMYHGNASDADTSQPPAGIFSTAAGTEELGPHTFTCDLPVSPPLPEVSSRGASSCVPRRQAGSNSAAFVSIRALLSGGDVNGA